MKRTATSKRDFLSEMDDVIIRKCQKRHFFSFLHLFFMIRLSLSYFSLSIFLPYFFLFFYLLSLLPIVSPNKTPHPPKECQFSFDKCDRYEPYIRCMVAKGCDIYSLPLYADCGSQVTACHSLWMECMGTLFPLCSTDPPPTPPPVPHVTPTPTPHRTLYPHPSPSALNESGGITTQTVG